MIYVFLADGFEETEAITPIDCLRRAGRQVLTVGIGGKTVKGSHGIPVTADITEEAAALNDALEMIVLPGGMPGTLNLGASETVQKAIRFCSENGRKLAAICAAPSVFGDLGLLKGHRAVCFPGFEEHLTGAEIGNEPVCVSGNFITSRGAGTAMDFGLKLVAVLESQDAADALAKKMVYLR